MNETQAGGSLFELVAWVDRVLVRPGRLLPRKPFPRITVREECVGVLSFGHPGKDGPSLYLAQSEAPRLVRVARRRVVAALEGIARQPADDRFVQAALYDGRVSRESAPDRTHPWRPLVTEDHNLSDQVLALFAADVLDHRGDYERSLVLCEACGWVGFWPNRLSYRGCPEHPAGVAARRLRAHDSTPGATSPMLRTNETAATMRGVITIQPLYATPKRQRRLADRLEQHGFVCELRTRFDQLKIVSFEKTEFDAAKEGDAVDYVYRIVRDDPSWHERDCGIKILG